MTSEPLNAHTYNSYSLFQSHEDLKMHASTYYTPVQLAQIYNFPQGNGSGVKIGIIQLGGGYYPNDLNTYLNNLGITDRPTITNVSIDGATNNVSDGSGANMEVTLDLQIIAAIAPKSNIRIYFAPNTTTGFYNAIQRAITDGCKLISISWGLYESGYGSQNLTNYNNLFKYAADQGIIIAVAAGDNGSSDGTTLNNSLNVDFPASSPYVTAVGGTSLYATNNIRTSEVVWNNNPTSSATGGGLSRFFTKPAYQSNIPEVAYYRGVPDLAFDADPNTGYLIYYNGNWAVVGGTSCGSPLLTGLMARIIQNKTSAFLNPILYNNKQIFYDILQGNNGAYTANDSYDLCSGLGVANCTLLSNLFTSPPAQLPVASFTYTPSTGNAPLTVTFTNTSQNAVSYLWQYDGKTSTTTNLVYTFNTPGSYVVTLNVFNANGADSVSHTIIVQAAPVAPIASFTYSPSTGNAPLTVTFTNTSQNATSYLWHYDGKTSTATHLIYTFNNPGNYIVTLTAYNAIGSNSVSHTIVVQSLPILPIASFTNSPLTGDAPLNVTFTNTSQNATSYLWQFGDGQTSNLVSPTHLYTSPGTYTIILTAYNNYGSDSETSQIFISTPISITNADFIYTVSGNRVTFINTSTAYVACVWSFGDYYSTTAKNPTHYYYKSGSYNVTLTVYGALKDSITKTITI